MTEAWNEARIRCAALPQTRRFLYLLLINLNTYISSSNLVISYLEMSNGIKARIYQCTNQLLSAIHLKRNDSNH